MRQNFPEAFDLQRTPMQAPHIVCQASDVPILCVGIKTVEGRSTGGAALLEIVTESELVQSAVWLLNTLMEDL